MHLAAPTMLWFLILGLAVEAQGAIHCSGEKLTLQAACGETITLPCQFSWVGPQSPSKYELVWQLRKDKKDFVVHDDDILSPANLQQSRMFANRTHIQEGWDQHGNATLQIEDIAEGDQGVYTCDLLTPKPFARKICTTITLVVNSYSTSCGNDLSLNASSGQSIQLPCHLKPGCRPRTKRAITWRFTTSVRDEEEDVPSAGDQGRKVVFSVNGTLNLKDVSSADTGTYCCYLEGAERCMQVQLRVIDAADANTDPELTLVRMCLYITFPIVVVGILTLFSLLYFRRIDPKELEEHHIQECGWLPAGNWCKTAQPSTGHGAPSSIKPSSVVKRSEGDDLEDSKSENSDSSTTVLLPVKSESGESNSSAPCKNVPV